jgi:Ca2+-dependent lipid-binding protein
MLLHSISSTTKDANMYRMKKEKKEKKWGKTSYNKVTVYKTETVHNNANPSWKPFTIDATVLCNNNFDQPFLVEVFDWDSTGVHDLIGKCTTTLREIQVMKELTLINPSKKHNPLYRAGMVAVDKCARVQ